MKPEYLMLLGACAWGLVHLSAASFAFNRQVGTRYRIGPRDEALQPTGKAARLQRAHANFNETFPLFLAAIFLVDVTDAFGTLSLVGSALYLGGRIAFLPLYWIGVYMARTLAWCAATLGIVMVGVAPLVSTFSFG